MQLGKRHFKHCLGVSGYTAVCLLLSATRGFAQDDFFSSVNADIPRTSSRDTPYSLFGWITQKVAYGLDAPAAPFSRQNSELSRVETSVFAQLDKVVTDSVNLRFSGKAYHDAIYSLNDDVEYTSDERNMFRNRFEVKDFFLEKQFENDVYLKIGNQIFAWGLAEYSRITDLINTEDQFTFGQQDLEDLRLQVPATLLSFGIGDWQLDSVLTYRAGRNDTAPAQDEFDQLLRLRESGIALQRAQPDSQYEVFVRASTQWESGDLQIVAGEFNDNTLSVARIDSSQSLTPTVHLGQNRMRAAGVAGNWVNGSWLLFGEAGLHKDKAVRPTSDAFFRQAQGWEQKDQLQTALGLEYNGFRNLVLTFELDNTHTSDHDEFMLEAKDNTSVGTRVYWTTLNERVKLLAVWNELIDADTHIGRLSVNYNWSDRLTFGLLWMDYGSQRSSLYYDYRNNDVVQLQLQFNFQN